MHELHNIMLRDVLGQVEPMDSVRLLAWFLLTTSDPSVTPTCSVGEVVAATMWFRVEVPPNDITPGPKTPPVFIPVPLQC